MATSDRPKVAQMANVLRLIDGFRDAVRDLPGGHRRCVFDLILACEFDAGTKPDGQTAPEPAKTVIGSIVEFFKKRDNKPATLREIVEGSGFPYLTVRAYVQKKKLFRDRFKKVAISVSKGEGCHGNAGHWQLKKVPK